MTSYQLVRDHISRDTVEALQALLHLAEAGTVTGIAFAAVMKRRKYVVNVAGEAFRDPTFARGAVAALDDELREIVQSMAQASTTL